MKTKNNHGFTLIELLVVITIIGFLASISVVALNSTRVRARDARRISDIHQIQTALSLYFNDQKTYPLYSDGLLGLASSNCLDSSSQGFVAGSSCGNAYMKIVPLDPSYASDNNQFVYAYQSNDSGDSLPQDYCLAVYLEGDNNGYYKGYNYIYPSGKVSNDTTGCHF